MGEFTNKDRAEAAEIAAKRFAEITGLRWDKAEGRECAIGDLVGDLMHLARREGFDPQERVDNGIMHFTEEEVEQHPCETWPQLGEHVFTGKLVSFHDGGHEGRIRLDSEAGVSHFVTVDAGMGRMIWDRCEGKQAAHVRLNGVDAVVPGPATE